MNYYGVTDKGKVRSKNQDCFSITETENGHIILSLCDGMGGANAGEVASKLADSEFVTYVEQRLNTSNPARINYRDVLMKACDKANGIAYEYSLFDDSLSGMGTTIVAGIVRPDGLVNIINVGDSRAYHISHKQKSIKQVTRDHSYVETLIESGIITEYEAKNHPGRHVITRAVAAEPTVEADYYEIHMMKNDILLFCSDGLSNFVTDDEILQYSIISLSPEDICFSLLNMVLERGAGDNVTIVVLVR